MTSNVLEKHIKQVIKEIIELDEKDYIPIEDYLFMLDNPNPLFTPKKFVKLANEFPEEFKNYIDDKRPIKFNQFE